jgi:hypothetical protein
MKVNELLEFREELVNRHGEELAAVDKVVALMSVGMAAGQLPLELAVQIDRATPKKKGKPGRPALSRAATAPAARDGSVIATVLAAVESVPRTSREVADRCVPAVQGDGVSKSLSKLHEQGKIERSKENPYRYWLNGAKAAKGYGLPPKGGTPNGKREGMAGVTQQPRFGRGKLSEAIRGVCAQLPAGFSRLQVSEGLPEEWQDSKGTSAVCVNLLDMVAHGELTRVGQGSEARYTVARLKGTAPAARKGVTPSEKERRYQELRGEIRVPRDPEVEGS